MGWRPFWLVFELRKIHTIESAYVRDKRETGSLGPTTHNLARHALVVNDTRVWLKETPPDIAPRMTINVKNINVISRVFLAMKAYFHQKKKKKKN